jgi:IS30 family transposase
MPGSSSSLGEREEISRMLSVEPEVSWSAVGRVIERHRTTVAREVDANDGRDGYRPAVAERRAVEARGR